MNYLTWNVPLEVIKFVKKLVIEIGIAESYPLDYNKWIEYLTVTAVDDKYNYLSFDLDHVFKLINDQCIDYHIMDISNLFPEEDIEIVLENKIGKETEITPSNTLIRKVEYVKSSMNYDAFKEEYLKSFSNRIRLFVECIRYAISGAQNGSLIILKYSKMVTFYDFWNQFYMETRGTVIDIEREELVSCPYRKFFNIGQKPEVDFNLVMEKIEHAKHVTIRDKKDGSMIACSKYRDNLVITTPGSFSSEQSKWARKLLETYNPKFVQQIPNGLTFLFEAIYPENRIVVDYGNEQNLYLTNIRSIGTGRMLLDSEVCEFAHHFGFLRPELECSSPQKLSEDIHDENKYPANEKEGWVFVIQTDTDDLLVKFKVDDYCAVHRAMSLAASPRIIYYVIKEDKFDDFISKIPPIAQVMANNIMQVILNYRETKIRRAEEILKTVPEYIMRIRENLYKIILVGKFVDEYLEKNVIDLSESIKRDVRSHVKLVLKSRKHLDELMSDKHPSSKMKIVSEYVTTIFACIPKEYLDFNVSLRANVSQWVKANVEREFVPIITSYLQGNALDVSPMIHFRDIDFSSVIDVNTHLINIKDIDEQ